MLKALLDGNAVDPIAELPDAVEAVTAAIDRGDLQLLIPEMAFEEVGKASGSRRELLLNAAAVAEQVRDGAYSVGRGQIGVHRVAGDAEASYYQRVRGASEMDNHAADALITLTAHIEGAVLVTFDKRLFKRAGNDQRPAMNAFAMLALIGYELPTLAE